MAKKNPNLSQTTARLVLVLVLAFVAGMLSGCGIFGGEEKAEATPTAPPRTIVPTFTPTPVQPATATPEPVALNQTQVITVEAAAPAAAAPVTGTTAATDTAPVSGAADITGTSAATTTTAATTTAAVSAPVAAALVVTPSLKIETDIINVRSGPDTSFGLVGTANLGERFEIKGRNAEGSWYLICCVNGQQGWVSGQLTDEDHEELAPLVDAPAAPTPAPVAQAPAEQAPAPAPAEPTATPAPAAPAPAADPCAGIGGDGCKFKLKGGPSFANNGGNELKFQIAFVHSGIEGGQPQGSYFVWVEKDGQKLPVSDSVRSIALQAQQGPQGKYNYEYKIGRDQLPGGNVAGSYQIWVLDGNGERDSQTFSFTVPDGQGEVWMLFDQA
jgi:SH3-like domain-containing protein